MIDLVLVKTDMVRYMRDVKAVRGMRRGLSDHHVELYTVDLDWVPGLTKERW